MDQLDFCTRTGPFLANVVSFELFVQLLEQNMSLFVIIKKYCTLYYWIGKFAGLTLLPDSLLLKFCLIVASMNICRALLRYLCLFP